MANHKATKKDTRQAAKRRDRNKYYGKTTRNAIRDLKTLGDLIKREIIDKVDHKNLNLDVDFMKDQMCSTENLAIAIWQQLAPFLPSSVQLHCIKLYETPRIYVEYFG